MFKRILIIVGATLGGLSTTASTIFMVVHDPQTGEAWKNEPLGALIVFTLFILAMGAVGAFAGGLLASFVPSSQKRSQQLR